MNTYRIEVLDSEEDEIRQYPIGYLTVDDKGYHFSSLTHFNDRDTNEQTQLNKDIKKIYGIDFPCSVFYIDRNKQPDNLRNTDERNILIIPRDNGTGNSDAKIANYIRARQRNKPNIPELDKAKVYRIVNSGLNQTTVGDLFGKAKEDPRTMTYPVYRYKNYSRKSGVYAYAYSPDYSIIYVYFLGKKHGWYKYDKKSAGAGWIIDEMIQRARKGWGLNRFINKHPQTYYWKGTY